jgi:hypothetical protein
MTQLIDMQARIFRVTSKKYDQVINEAEDAMRTKITSGETYLNSIFFKVNSAIDEFKK